MWLTRYLGLGLLTGLRLGRNLARAALMLVADGRHSRRIGASTVAGSAAHFYIAFEIIFVDGLRHGNHQARSFLFLFVVFLEGAGGLHDVTVIAVHAQRSIEILHGRDQLIGGHSLE